MTETTRKKPGWLREAMPRVAGMIDDRRKEWGEAHVNAQVAAGMAGKPGHFYAIEAGHIVGTPFVEDAHNEEVRLALILGAAGMVMRMPAKEASDGKN